MISEHKYLSFGALGAVMCWLLLGCVVENPSAEENDADAGLDGGQTCNIICADTECPSGQVRIDEQCRCYCEPICDDVDCQSCPDGQTALTEPGRCCPTCLPQCEGSADCSDQETCIDGVCFENCDTVSCEACPDGWITDRSSTSCCSCEPACGPGSAFLCSEDERCVAGACRPGTDNCENVLCAACPPNTEPVPSDGCCPDCRPVDCQCPEVYEPVCARGRTFGNACVARCEGVIEFRPGECSSGICDLDLGCPSVCEQILSCFGQYCEVVLQRDLLFEGCLEACRSDDPVFSEICAQRSCDFVVELVTNEAGADFCGPSDQCDQVPEGVFYVATGTECELIDYACPPDATYYADECGCGCRFLGNECVNPQPDVDYFFYGDACEEVAIDCEFGAEFVRDECGCGCRYSSCGEAPPGVTYIGFGEECEFIRYDCGPNQDYFFDGCGCGCQAFDCECPAVEAPVCTPDGRRFANECEANCAGEYGARPCENDCMCPSVFDPVCGLDGRTYDNECFARCVEMPVVRPGSCEYSVCPEGYDTSCIDSCRIAAECFGEVCGSTEFDRLFSDCAESCEFQPYLSELVCGFSTCEEVVIVLGDVSGTGEFCDVEFLECPDESVADYLSYDPTACELFEFSCDEGQEAFSNTCGCGCSTGLDCPQEGAEARYVSRDPETCSRIVLTCPEQSESFNTECGCGCLY